MALYIAIAAEVVHIMFRHLPAPSLCSSVCLSRASDSAGLTWAKEQRCGYPSCLLATHQWPMALNSIILTHTLIIIRPFSA